MRALYGGPPPIDDEGWTKGVEDALALATLIVPCQAECMARRETRTTAVLESFRLSYGVDIVRFMTEVTVGPPPPHTSRALGLAITVSVKGLEAWRGAWALDEARMLVWVESWGKLYDLSHPVRAVAGEAPSP